MGEHNSTKQSYIEEARKKHIEKYGEMLYCQKKGGSCGSMFGAWADGCKEEQCSWGKETKRTEAERKSKQRAEDAEKRRKEREKYKKATEKEKEESKKREVTAVKKGEKTLASYYEYWYKTYKKGVVREVTLKKYELAHKWIFENVGGLLISEIDRPIYQQILNKYAETHEKQTVIDFHHLLKQSILDAVDEGYIEKDPTRRVVFKGNPERNKKEKYLSKYELQQMIADLNKEWTPSVDWLIYMIAKTGMRFSEAIAITPEDLDFNKMRIKITKTWDYKNGGGFVPTKNKSSERIIPMDWQLANALRIISENREMEYPIFVEKGRKIYNSTVNHVLARHCKNAGVEEITVHGLRHTHASLLLAAGVSIASVSKRLGHSNMATTQKVYLHIIRELDNQDTGTIIKEMSEF